MPNADSNPFFFHILTIDGGYVSWASAQKSSTFLCKKTSAGWRVINKKCDEALD
jgi:hypothetical protein